MTPPTMPGLPPLSDSPAMGVRRFGRVNWLGLRTLARREVMRFMAVWQQTIFAPLMTAGLFVVVFAMALGQGRGEIALASAMQGGWIGAGAWIIWEESRAPTLPAGVTLLDRRSYGDTVVTLARVAGNEAA